ncbi:MAG: hypothetical protein AB1422_05875 [bacterium]
MEIKISIFAIISIIHDRKINVNKNLRPVQIELWGAFTIWDLWLVYRFFKGILPFYPIFLPLFCRLTFLAYLETVTNYYNPLPNLSLANQPILSV